MASSYSRFAALSLATTLLGCGADSLTDATGQVSQALSQTLVISQVYTRGGNLGATWNRDYVELFNRGTAAAPIAGMSVQYRGGGGTWYVAEIPAGTAALQPGQYYLVGLTIGSFGTALSVTPDVAYDPTIGLAGADVRVALVNGTTALTCNTCATATGVIDFVGIGNASEGEGGTQTGVPTDEQAAFRKANGCVETDNNANDFELKTPAPRNRASTGFSCLTDAGTDAFPVIDVGTDAIATDTKPADTSPADTGAADTSATDANAADANAADADANAADGAVSDVTVTDAADGSLADTRPADTAVAETIDDDAEIIEDTEVRDVFVADNGTPTFDTGSDDAAVDGAPTEDSGGCGCRTPASSPTRAFGALPLLGLALAAALRRRTR